MNTLGDMIWIELRKALRSRLPLFIGFGFLFIPLATGFVAFIFKNPELARGMGLISTKANLVGSVTTWPDYLSVVAQAVALGGFILLSLILSWIFGREFADGTLKDLMAVPVPRLSILAAKFLTAALWFSAMIALVVVLCLLAGALVGFPPVPARVFAQWGLVLVLTTLLNLCAGLPVAFFASAGRGYLLPMGMAILLLLLGNVAAIAGWGDVFPWSIPALAAGMVKEQTLGPLSYLVSVAAALAALVLTGLWWLYADQDR